MMKKKNAVLAGILQFALFGGGTIYLGRRVGIGIVVTVGGTMAQMAEIAISPVFTNAAPAIWPFLLGGLVILKLGLVADVVRETREVNAAVPG